jgi:hypothetical protein
MYEARHLLAFSVRLRDGDSPATALDSAPLWQGSNLRRSPCRAIRGTYRASTAWLDGVNATRAAVTGDVLNVWARIPSIRTRMGSNRWAIRRRFERGSREWPPMNRDGERARSGVRRVRSSLPGFQREALHRPSARWVDYIPNWDTVFLKRKSCTGCDRRDGLDSQRWKRRLPRYVMPKGARRPERFTACCARRPLPSVDPAVDK